MNNFVKKNLLVLSLLCSVGFVASCGSTPTSSSLPNSETSSETASENDSWIWWDDVEGGDEDDEPLVQYNTIDYLDFTQEEKERSIFQGTMYIWMFGINDKVYYGRTYKELYNFLNRIEFYTTYEKKIVYVHNLAFEFNWLRNIFKFKNVMARKSRKVMKCEIEEYNIEFRCTLFMTNSKLEKIPDLYKFEVKKLVGQLDYSKIRHSKTKLSKKELEYCENDCLIIYEYIKKELETYETTKNTPLTSTSHVRRELKELIEKNWDYLNKTRKSINVDGHIYNMMVKAFAGRIHTRQLAFYR